MSRVEFTTDVVQHTGMHHHIACPVRDCSYSPDVWNERATKPGDDSQELDAFMEDAAAAPWRPEPTIDGDGLCRRLDTIWLTNDDGDSLQVDEDTAAMLVNALRTLWSER